MQTFGGERMDKVISTVWPTDLHNVLHLVSRGIDLILKGFIFIMCICVFLCLCT